MCKYLGFEDLPINHYFTLPNRVTGNEKTMLPSGVSFPAFFITVSIIVSLFSCSVTINIISFSAPIVTPKNVSESFMPVLKPTIKTYGILFSVSFFLYILL